MSEHVLLCILLSVITAAAQLGGGAAALRASKFPYNLDRILLALGAGFLIALVFLELIPESFTMTHDPESSVVAMLIGFSALHFFEHTFVEHFHFGEETHHDHEHHHHTSVFGAVGGLTLHSLFDGMAIGAIASVRTELGILIAAAIILHKIPEGMTVTSIMLMGKKTHRQALQAALLLGIATIAGTLLTLFIISLSTDLIGFLFAFSAGAALYVGACDLIPEINKTRGRLAPFLVFLGMALFYIGLHVIGHAH
jgi:zinc transporter ZupT